MKFNFAKYHGAGNDFILFDARTQEVSSQLNSLTKEQLEALCHRRFGIGADGIMFLEAAPEGYDFKMRYFNSDGAEGTMCGNGGRCIVRFADDLNIGGEFKKFTAVDGEHEAQIHKDNTIALGMVDVDSIHQVDEGWFLDTGSPHLVLIDEPYITQEAIMLRRKYDANINFLNFTANDAEVRTYERGVEDETWACGTGTTAVALVRSLYENGADGDYSYDFKVKGGLLNVSFNRTNSLYTNVILRGRAKRVFSGEVQIDG